MDSPIHIDTISMELSICILRGCRSKILHNDVFLSPNIVFILANRADFDDMPPYVAFHLDLYCLPKYVFTGVHNENGLLIWFKRETTPTRSAKLWSTCLLVLRAAKTR